MRLESKVAISLQAFVVCALVGLSLSAPAPDISSHVVHHGHHSPVVAHAVHQPHHVVHHAPVVVPHHVAPVYPAPPVHKPVVVAAPAYKPAPAPYKPVVKVAAPVYPAPAPVVKVRYFIKQFLWGNLNKDS